MQTELTHFDQRKTRYRRYEKRLMMAIAVLLFFVVVECIGGHVSGSLALLADAGHMLNDSIALLLTLAAIKLSQRAPDSRFHYGYDRFTVLAAFINGISLIAIALWIVVEAIQRFSSPYEIQSQLMLGIAVIGLAVNLLVFYWLSDHDHTNVCMKAASMHVLADILGSVTAIIAALGILLFNATWLDSVLSVAIALLITHAAVPIIKDSANILLAASPETMHADNIKQQLIHDIAAIHTIEQFRAWSLSPQHRVASMRISLFDDADMAGTQQAVKKYINEHYNIHDVTIEITPL